MRHSNTRELFRYWDKLRSDRPAPMRTEFEPAAVGSILGSLFMLEVACDIATIRLAGGNVCAMFGEELRGKAFAKIWLNGVDRKPSTIASHCIDERSPYLLRADGLTREGSVSQLEIILVPLQGKNDQTDRVVGTISDIDQDSPFVKKHLIGMSLTSIIPVKEDTIPVNFNKREGVKPFNSKGSELSSEKNIKKSGPFQIIDGGLNS